MELTLESLKLYCNSCDIICKNEEEWKLHISTENHSKLNKKNKIIKYYLCNSCDIKCNGKYDWERHIKTRKHNNNKIELCKEKEKEKDKEKKYKCNLCNIEYNSRTSLWYHKKNSKCLNNNDKDENKKNETDIQSKLLTEIIKQNYELQKQLFDLANKPNIINNYNNNNTTNTTNNQFNLNMFLNEQCKNAVNMEDFLDSIKLTVMDFEETGKLGFVSGISRIFIENIKKLDIHERPLHCTDLKRETVYIKENNKWEKEDTNKTKLNNVVKRIVKKNIC